MLSQQMTTGSWSLEVQIAATRARVWAALTTESTQWWPKDFVTSERTLQFVIEARVGGRVFEDFGNGEGLLWYSVVGVNHEKELQLAGHLLPPFGGPAVTSLRIALTAIAEGTLMTIRDDRFGVLGGEPPVEGWRLVFDAGLRTYLERDQRSRD